MKRVAINAVVLHERSGGLGQYMNYLIQFFGEKKFEFEPVIYLSKKFYETSGKFKKYNNIKTLDVSPYNPVKRIFREAFVWRKTLRTDHIDLFFSPLSYIPLGVNVPSVMTIHDLGYFHFKEHYTFLRVNFLKKMIRSSAGRAEKIITISDYSKKDIVHTFNLNPDKIAVIYEGINTDFFAIKYSGNEITTIKEKYNLPDKYILSVGHLEPRKNYCRLIEAFHQLKVKYNIEHSLVIVGQENWYFKEIYHKVSELDLNNSVIFTKFVEKEALPAVYQLADLFVTASLFEGFGFTPLESMAAGTPAAVSDCTSLPEITGDAALLFDPYDIDDIAEKLYVLLTNGLLRKKLIGKGFENIKRFQWETCCLETAKELTKVLEKK
ncbi:glycosyltransferase family 4 protein [candidate division KSB1 bacterium]|nr:glycosyltransferase family 4 protein [candidate division KSB1 bacterium]